MKRLSSKKAKKILEFLAKKRLNASSVSFSFKEHGFSDYLYEVEVDVAYEDGKGVAYSLRVIPPNTLWSYQYVQPRSPSFAKLLRCIEAGSSKQGIFILQQYTHTFTLFKPGDSIEETLVEMDLEEDVRNE